ncbi:hypothetical protein P9A16_31885 [Shinella sp. 838]|uniref:hypothetical protein n=1 Tax=unclassified Shinella TaxID=2643062 RepID=UPI0012DFE273|nr:MULTISPECIES: hypothetical protein [unclassified Shinella]MCA0344224.1 hypothetical protein [Pseudomonadota bacterium]MDG4675704.1 hypothetical protein [Shinella sp. 838]
MIASVEPMDAIGVVERLREHLAAILSVTIRYQNQLASQAGFIHTVGGAAIHRADFYRRGDFDTMAVQHLSIAPEYVSFYVAGRQNVDIPVHMDRQGIFVSNDCVNIPAYYWSDGDTHVTLGPYSEVAEAREPDSDTILNTPNQQLILFDANEPRYAIAQVPSTKTRIRVWMDHPVEPSNVTIAFG